MNEFLFEIIDLQRLRILFLLAIYCLLLRPLDFIPYRSIPFRTILPACLNIDLSRLQSTRSFSPFQLTLWSSSPGSLIGKSFLPSLWFSFLLPLYHPSSSCWFLSIGVTFHCPLKWWFTICSLDIWLELFIRFTKSGRILNSMFLFFIYSFSCSSIICFTYSLNSSSINVATKQSLNSKSSLRSQTHCLDGNRSVLYSGKYDLISVCCSVNSMRSDTRNLGICGTLT